MLAHQRDAEVFQSEIVEGSASGLDGPKERLAATFSAHRAARILPAQRNYMAKRMFDVMFSAAVLMATLPLYPLLVLAICLDSAGPALFRQVRIGKDGRPFVAYKFRTMHHDVAGQGQSIQLEIVERWMATTPRDAESNSDSQWPGSRGSPAHVRGRTDGGRGVTSSPRNGLLRWHPRTVRTTTSYKFVGDPRITRVGSFLRKTSLDELPQFLNVLRGEMSIVGPRPSLLCEVERYHERDLARLRVMPGITGIWQVRGRGRVSFIQMVEMDLEYAVSGSFWADIVLILRTIPAVLSGTGAA
jgi:lipopolysaccharide/colanic/teichoic acid biosynthesis glycosyltransferase